MAKIDVFRARLEKKLGTNDRWVEWAKGIVRSTIRDAVELVVEMLGETDDRMGELSKRVEILESKGNAAPGT